MKDRAIKIIKVSFLGIIMNVLLSVAKLIVGIIVGAISIILDAVNNLSDAVSQIVTIVGTAFSMKPADKKHPYGYGRIEYITSQVMAAIIIAVGVASLSEAIQKIFDPGEPDYAIYSMVILAVAIVLKLLYALYTRFEGKKLNAKNLLATSTDSLMDSFLTLGTLVAGIIVYFGGYNIEGYVACVIAVLIIKAGIELMIDAIKSIIGNRIDSDMSKKIKDLVNSYDEVLGTYDLVLHEYGPSKTIGSLHVEVEDRMTASEIHALTRKITEEVYSKLGIFLTIGIYASNSSTTYFTKIKETVKNLVDSYDEILEVHGFYVREEKVSFDLVFDFKCKDRKAVVDKIREILTEKYPNYEFDIVIDNDFSD